MNTEKPEEIKRDGMKFKYTPSVIKIWFLVCLLSSVSFIGRPESKATVKKLDYIKKYKAIAIIEMQRTGIPASITLAQALLESGFGNSKLTRYANNHFGIKCHKTWKGEKIFLNDDEKNECFRKYKTPEQSFIDHSNFIQNNPRYNSLFDLKREDYKSWALELKKAGYATNPKYSELLIEIIEELQLFQYDGKQEINFIKKDSQRTIELLCENKNVNPVSIEKHSVTPNITHIYHINLQKLLEDKLKRSICLRTAGGINRSFVQYKLFVDQAQFSRTIERNQSGWHKSKNNISGCHKRRRTII